jgi:hypothetical protein
MFNVLEAQEKATGHEQDSHFSCICERNFEEQKLTIGVGLGDRWPFYCVLDEAGKAIQTTRPEVMKQTFGKIQRSLIALNW